MESINHDSWLSINGAASYLNLSPSFLRKQVRNQRIPFARPGGKVLRFRRSDLDPGFSRTAPAKRSPSNSRPLASRGGVSARFRLLPAYRPALLCRGIPVTVMIDSFFGVHPAVVRGGLWSKMKPGEKDLYVYRRGNTPTNRIANYFCS